MKRRLINVPYLTGFCILLGIEVAIALFVHDRFIRPYVGDVLVVMVLYCLIRAFWRTPPRLLPFWIFLFAAGVEVGQYFQLVQKLHLEQYTILRIALGSTFDVADLVCYGVGGGLLFLWQAKE